MVTVLEVVETRQGSAEIPLTRILHAGRARLGSVLLDGVVKNDEIEDLRESLHRGGVIARKSVGEPLGF